MHLAGKELRSDDFYQKQRKNDQNYRPYNFRSFFHGQTGADVIAGHVADGGGYSQRDHCLSVQKKYDERCDICRQINDFRLCVRRSQTHFGKYREGYNKESSCSGSVESVIDSDDKCSCRRDKVSPSVHPGLSSTFLKQVLVQDKECGKRKNDEQNIFHHLLAHAHRKPGSERSTCHRADYRGHCELEVDQLMPNKTECCKCGTARGGQFIGRNGCMDRKTREKICGKRDQPSASADRVDEAGKKKHGAYNKKHFGCEIHISIHVDLYPVKNSGCRLHATATILCTERIRVKLTDILFKNIRHNKFSEDIEEDPVICYNKKCILRTPQNSKV